jgi:hypothetical protein
MPEGTRKDKQMKPQSSLLKTLGEFDKPGALTASSESPHNV